MRIVKKLNPILIMCLVFALGCASLVSAYMILSVADNAQSKNTILDRYVDLRIEDYIGEPDYYNFTKNDDLLAGLIYDFQLTYEYKVDKSVPFQIMVNVSKVDITSEMIELKWFNSDIKEYVDVNLTSQENCLKGWFTIDGGFHEPLGGSIPMLVKYNVAGDYTMTYLAAIME